MYRSYDLLVLAKRKVRLKIRKCPRCGGFIYWPYPLAGTNQEKLIFRDKIKCFTCGRMFYLARTEKKPVWQQWPDRPETISLYFEDLK